MTHLQTVSVGVADYELQLDTLQDDVCYLSVVPRHGQAHPPASALLKGLGWHRGTIATTIAHDSHNIIVAGHQPIDMLLAVQELEKFGGGIVLVDEQKVLAKVELPLAGLMSLKTVPELAEEMTALNEIAKRWGIEGSSPALSISGLALTVIPQVRISDLLGLFDVASQSAIPVFP